MQVTGLGDRSRRLAVLPGSPAPGCRPLPLPQWPVLPHGSPLPIPHCLVARCRALLCWTVASPRRSPLGLLYPSGALPRVSSCPLVDLVEALRSVSSGRCYPQVISPKPGPQSQSSSSLALVISPIWQFNFLRALVDLFFSAVSCYRNGFRRFRFLYYCSCGHGRPRSTKSLICLCPNIIIMFQHVSYVLCWIIK